MRATVSNRSIENSVCELLDAPPWGPMWTPWKKAMAEALIRPDTEFEEGDRSIAPWHFIDICFA